MIVFMFCYSNYCRMICLNQHTSIINPDLMVMN